MGVKSLLEDKFVELCRSIGECPEVRVGARSKTKTSFEFDIGDMKILEVTVGWDELVDLISDMSKLDGFLRESLDYEADAINRVDAIDDDDIREDDPFSSGELAFDADGRVHFASDLRKQL